MPLAYSYIRFSTKDQIQGDSLRRQTELSQNYCDEHGLTLAEVPFEDKGVSAYKGGHAVTGALSKFISLVDSGKIKAGSYLLIESFDRLSREDTDTAMSRFLDLRSKGIIIVTLADNKVFDKTSDTSKMTMDLMYSLMIMGRAHEESQMKSQRLSAAWSAKRRKAQQSKAPLTSKCPAWIELVDGKYQLIPERAKVVEEIVEMTMSGMGKGTVARQLNVANTPTFGRGKIWWTSYVQKIIDSPALYGTYQPKSGGMADGSPIEDYYPAIIDKETYYKMRAARATPLARGRKGKAFSNLLSSIATCSKCGRSYHFKDKGEAKGGKYLLCSSRIAGNCDAAWVRYDDVETITILTLTQLDLSSITAPLQTNNKRADIENAIDELGRRIANLTEVLATGVKEVRQAFDAAVKERSELEKKLESLEVEQASTSPLKEAQAIINDLKHKEGTDLYQLRERIHRLLKRAVVSFVIDGTDKSFVLTLNDYSGPAITFTKAVNGLDGIVKGASQK